MSRKQPSDFKSDIDIRPLEDGMSPEETIQGINKLINHFNFVNKFVSFQSNFDGKIISVTIPPVTDTATLGVIKIEHFLGVTPKWRVILRQEGNGVISDIPSGWNENIITIKNNGSEQVKLSLLIARE